MAPMGGAEIIRPKHACLAMKPVFILPKSKPLSIPSDHVWIPAPKRRLVQKESPNKEDTALLPKKFRGKKEKSLQGTALPTIPPLTVQRTALPSELLKNTVLTDLSSAAFKEPTMFINPDWGNRTPEFKKCAEAPLGKRPAESRTGPAVSLQESFEFYKKHVQKRLPFKPPVFSSPECSSSDLKRMLKKGLTEECIACLRFFFFFFHSYFVLSASNRLHYDHAKYSFDYVEAENKFTFPHS